MPRMQLRIREVDIKAGAKSKGSNGGVAVGFPHRNYSVFKQAAPNKRQVKRKNKKKEQGEHQRIYIRRSIKNGGLEGGKKSGGGWGKIKSPWTAFHGSLVLNDER